MAAVLCKAEALLWAIAIFLGVYNSVPVIFLLKVGDCASWALDEKLIL
jgi:hypothetical protein